MRLKACLNCGKDITGTHFNRKYCDVYCRGEAYGDIARGNANKWRLENPGKAKVMDMENHLRRKFGITIADYTGLLEAQGGKCAICEKRAEEVIDKVSRRLAVDHCHDTGKVRGLLCRVCNTAIGQLQDDPEIIMRAAIYVESAK
ncbi:MULTISPECIES: endonuclease VII domain-containing protein [unclassified Streptomyces]|uniref:endonuclease VII domain-containing protein n=1 Tax=Streptomyces sp. NPDC055082 TaxID=3365718 RepID=UPI0037CDFABD